MASLLFESKTCSRCAGSGSYSWNQRDGSRCFGCGGRGIVLTKRGAAAQAFYTASVTVTMADLVPGDVIVLAGFDMLGIASEHATVVEIGDLHEYGQSATNGVYSPIMGRTLRTVGVKSGKPHNLTAHETATFRKVWTAEETAAKQAAALAYQGALTATGTVSKRKALVLA